MTQTQTRAFGLSSFALRNLAMIFMLIDHVGFTFFPDQIWIRCIGRIAFPIFAFLIVEGYFHTRHLGYYFLRLLLLALVSDVPFMYQLNGRLEYTPFKNVIWTFLIGLATIAAIDWLGKHQPKLWIRYPLSILIIAATSYLAYTLNSDYDFLGVLTIVSFYACRGKEIGRRVLLFICLLLIHLPIATLNLYHTNSMLMDLNIFFSYFKIYGLAILSPQYHALWALIFIWLYNGKAGHKSKASQLFSYFFYPIHLLILGFIKPPL